MSRRAEGRDRYFGRVESARRGRGGVARCRLPVESLEGRVFLSVSAQADLGFRLIGITGNQQSELTARYPDETLFDIKVGSPGTDPAFLDGFTPPPGAATTLMTIDAVPGIPSFNNPVTQGTGALRVDVPQTGGTFWGLRSANIVDLLRAGVDTLTYDETFIGRELNGGSFVGTDDSFTGYAQSNEMAITLGDGSF